MIAKRYAKKMADNMNESSRIGMMCPSILISGAGNFPVRKKEKQNVRDRSNMEDFNVIQGYIRKLKDILYGKEVIRSDEDNAIEQLEDKLDKLENMQNKMKEVNAFYRKNKTLEGCPYLISKEIAKIEDHWKMGWYKGVPFPTYSLSNNNAKIKEARSRIEELRRIKSNETKENEINLSGFLFTVKENIEDMRVQLFFEGKPEEDVRNILKGEAFKWSPKNGCWQRQLTDNARIATKRVISKIKELKRRINKVYVL